MIEKFIEDFKRFVKSIRGLKRDVSTIMVTKYRSVDGREWEKVERKWVPVPRRVREKRDIEDWLRLKLGLPPEIDIPLPDLPDLRGYKYWKIILEVKYTDEKNEQ